MTDPQMMGVGFVVGIVVFFWLQRLGVIDRWLERLDR